MLGFDPIPDYLREELFAPARYLLDKMPPPGKSDDVVREIYGALYGWQLLQRDHEGRVLKTVGDFTVLTTPTATLVPMEDAAPWECAGHDVANPLDLALKLWAERSPVFLHVCDKYGAPFVFALLALVERNDLPLPSLIRVNGLLTRMVTRYADIYEKAAESLGRQARKQRAGLPTGRVISAENRRQKKAQRDEQMQQLAFEYSRAHPSAKTLEVADYVQKRFFPKLALSTIERTIKGSKTKAIEDLERSLKRPKTDLYASSGHSTP